MRRRPLVLPRRRRARRPRRRYRVRLRTLFSFNGRHPVAVEPIVPGVPVRKAFAAKAGKHYTLAVHVVFEREGCRRGRRPARRRGQAAARRDHRGHVRRGGREGSRLARPERAAHRPLRTSLGNASAGPPGVGPAELVAERLVGPYHPEGDRNVTYSVKFLHRIGSGKAG